MRKLLALVGLMGALGCGHATTTYLHPNADLAVLKSVAVLPFDNLTSERTAADKVQKVFLSELLATGVFNVAEPGLVAKMLKSEHVESTETMGPADVKRIGEALKVEALFMGYVVDFADNRTGSTPAPEVTIQLKLVETQTGVTVWSASETRSGASMSARLLGIGGESLTQAARKLMKKELRTLVR